MLLLPPVIPIQHDAFSDYLTMWVEFDKVSDDFVLLHMLFLYGLDIVLWQR